MRETFINSDGKESAASQCFAGAALVGKPRRKIEIRGRATFTV